MAPSIFERIQAKLELLRLEKRYTRHRDRRSTFVSNAVYVDGEYIYQTPATTGSSTSSNQNSPSPSFEPAYSPTSPTGTVASKERKKMNRFSSMPGFGHRDVQPPQDWRLQRSSFDGTR